MSKPHINVTPLIDVLLVLLIIFMVVSPLRPDAFKAKVPAELTNDTPSDPQTLVVIIGKDSGQPATRTCSSQDWKISFDRETRTAL